ncbi:beta-1,3-galactosyltransferase 1-like [Branchiostoma floridae]|uniref:Hexosyltransferase n=3 Tax=Branchiostoma floridae TaxID=7739 RepID=A0A9J7KFH4_BRAFL|nr:beta-1,3-galactosyltransferase 1-like [Branchiostoma floridae]XP_035657744.1 beta-1,3-galactosyltransferase 1-like [Branchiostoma floridae]
MKTIVKFQVLIAFCLVGTVFIFSYLHPEIYNFRRTNSSPAPSKRSQTVQDVLHSVQGADLVNNTRGEAAAIVEASQKTPLDNPYNESVPVAPGEEKGTEENDPAKNEVLQKEDIEPPAEEKKTETKEQEKEEDKKEEIKKEEEKKEEEKEQEKQEEPPKEEPKEEPKEPEEKIEEKKPDIPEPKKSIKSELDLNTEVESGSHRNPHPYKLTMNHPDKCADQDVFLIVIISTIHKNVENRRAIRETWGSENSAPGFVVKRLFALGKTSDPKMQALVQKENEQFGDIIQEDFVDTYHNLTLKTVMCLRWVSNYCAHSKFFMKTDDDMYVSFANLAKVLQALPTEKARRMAMGYVISGAPIRNPKSKWYMPKETYPGNKYPPFCSGTGYIVSTDICGELYRTSLDMQYLYLEDVFVATCFEKIGVVPQGHKDFHNWRVGYNYCTYKRILTAHMVTPPEMIRIWKDQKAHNRRC